MTTRVAACRCGALTATCVGEPVRVSVCHCLDCQRRSGSAFAAQARFPERAVTIAGPATTWRTVGESGRAAEFGFCPTCGGPVFYRNEGLPGFDELVAIPLGAFADPGFPPPRFSVWESRKHPWLAIAGEGIEHD